MGFRLHTCDSVLYLSIVLIDDFLSDYDVHERHQIKVNAAVDKVYAAVRRLDISRAKLSMLLFRLRGIPAGALTPSCFTLEDFLEMGFILLGERENEELVLGLVGRFWTPSGELPRLDTDGFRRFATKGYAKAAWNFTLREQSDNSVLLETETRIFCTDDASRRRFKLYWLFIGAFSGLVRRDLLRAIKRNAEESVTPTA